jgi:hypothetical protein
VCSVVTDVLGNFCPYLWNRQRKKEENEERNADNKKKQRVS